jgi:hypothetical protein
MTDCTQTTDRTTQARTRLQNRQLEDIYISTNIYDVLCSMLQHDIVLQEGIRHTVNIRYSYVYIALLLLIVSFFVRKTTHRVLDDSHQGVSLTPSAEIMKTIR